MRSTNEVTAVTNGTGVSGFGAAGDGTAGGAAARRARALEALEGTSIGDAFGECFFRPAFASRLIHRIPPDKRPWRWTDDTAMAISVTESLLVHGRIDQDELAQAFAARFSRDPGRGYGGGAARLLTAVGDGADWRKAARQLFGGEGSFGNGGAMRAAPIGAYFADDTARAADEAVRSAEVTHAHAEGQAGAVAIAVAAAIAWQRRAAWPTASELCEAVASHVPSSAVRAGLERAAGLSPGTSRSLAAKLLGNGSGISAQDTAPFCVWVAGRYGGGSVEEALWETVSALGDRDTTCAIVGGILGAARGLGAFPAGWREAREPLPPLLGA